MFDFNALAKANNKNSKIFFQQTEEFKTFNQNSTPTNEVLKQNAKK